MRASCAVLMLGAAHSALAQTAPAAGPADPGEIIVTAQRRAEPLQRTPIAITTFTPEAVNQRGLVSLQELSGFVPNLEINQGRADSGGAGIALYIRGVGQNDYQFPNDPGVGLYLDGVYISRAVGANLELFDLERIEVLRGPQGTLYGKNTIGGAINLVTIQPSLTETNGLLRMTAGAYNRIDAGGWVSTPLVRDHLAVKLSAVTLNRDGFVRRPLATREAGQRLGDFDRFAFRGALRWQPGPRFEATLTGDYSRQREFGAAQRLINSIPSEVLVPAPIPDPTPSTRVDLRDLFNVAAAPFVNRQLGLPADSRFDSRWISSDPFVNFGTGAARNRNDTSGLSLNLLLNLSERWSVRSITAYRQLDSFFRQDSDASPYSVVDVTTDPQNQHQISQELQINYESPRFNFVAGGFFMDETANDAKIVLLVNPLTQITGGNVNLDWNPVMRLRAQTYAVFAQANWFVTDKLRLTLGGRYSEDHKRLTQNFRTILFPITDQFGNRTFCYTCLSDGQTSRVLEESWGAFTPRVGLDYQLTPTANIYANYSRGFKSGGWSPRPTPTNPAELPFDPEFLDSFEVGAKTQFFDRHLTLNAAAFYNIYSDIQLTVLAGNFQLQVINAGEAELYGFELEAAARPIDGLDLNASVGYLHNRFTRLTANDPQLSRSDKLPDAPEWVVNLGGQYGFGTPLGRLKLRADAVFRSLTWKDTYNLDRSSILQFAGGRPAGEVAIPSGRDGYLVTQRRLAQRDFWIVNARAGLDVTDRLEVAGFVTNVFDQRYFTAIQPVSAFGLDQGYLGRPREWGVQATWRF